MKVSDLMTGITPNPSYDGVVMADNYVLAIDIGGAEATAPGNYVVAQAGIEGGLSVGSIPEEVKTSPVGMYKYVGGEFVLNADYTEPTKEPTLTTEERLEQIGTTITDLQEMYFEILMEV